MPYSVQFVGLACFLEGDKEGVNVLLPDGRVPPTGVEPHYASLIVAAASVNQTSGWDNDTGTGGIFPLSPCSISFEGADEPGVLDTTQQAPRLPHLRDLAPGFVLDPARAETIARAFLRRGSLTAYSIPGGEAVISQLDVPHDGGITIRIVPDDGSPERTIDLAPGTEIVLANMASGGYMAEDEHVGHFQIYDRLSTNPVPLSEPEPVPDLPPSPSHHILFARNSAIGLGIGCSNTGYP